jgi:hypothetical protein
MNLLSGRQVTVIVVAVCAALVASPVVALAATGTFASSSASQPAVSAKNSSSGSGAKAVSGNASASSGSVYGVYGHTNSSHGYGVYSAGRLGTSGALACAHCVTGADVNAATLPTVPSASKLGGHAPSYYARIVPLSDVLPRDGSDQHLADVAGLKVLASCSSAPNYIYFAVAADSSARVGTVNYFYVSGTSAQSGGAVLDTTYQIIAHSSGGIQTEGNLVYRDNATGQIITFDFHLFGDGCQLFGSVITTA